MSCRGLVGVKLGSSWGPVGVQSGYSQGTVGVQSGRDSWGQVRIKLESSWSPLMGQSGVGSRVFCGHFKPSCCLGGLKGFQSFFFLFYKLNFSFYSILHKCIVEH